MSKETFLIVYLDIATVSWKVRELYSLDMSQPVSHSLSEQSQVYSVY